MNSEIRKLGLCPTCPTTKVVVGQIGQVSPPSESYESDEIGRIGQALPRCCVALSGGTAVLLDPEDVHAAGRVSQAAGKGGAA